jgi:hypothetical protein
MDDQDVSDVDDPQGLIDHTKRKGKSDAKLKKTTENHVKKYFKILHNTETPEYQSIEELPEDYDFKSFLGTYSDHIMKNTRVSRFGGLRPTLSKAYSTIVKKYPDVEYRLHGTYAELLRRLKNDYRQTSLQKNIPFQESKKCPNRNDMDYLAEQLFLGGILDAKFRAAIFGCNVQFGARVSEVSICVFVYFTIISILDILFFNV